MGASLQSWMSEDDVEVLEDEERYEGNRVIRRKVMEVPQSSKYPEGVKYRLHYGTLDGDTIIRYDNSHGIHEKHEGENTEEIEYPGMTELIRRFNKVTENK